SLPTIGMLPQQAREARDWRWRFGNWKFGSWKWPTMPPAGDSAVAARFALDHPDSPYAENLRAVHARLKQSGLKSRNEILVVLSSVPGEGKSTFASNLALSLAISGVRTLLVDGDVYARSISKVFGLKQPGLCELV